MLVGEKKIEEAKETPISDKESKDHHEET